jgi:hypothetical protein
VPCHASHRPGGVFRHASGVAPDGLTLDRRIGAAPSTDRDVPKGSESRRLDPVLSSAVHFAASRPMWSRRGWIGDAPAGVAWFGHGSHRSGRCRTVWARGASSLVRRRVVRGRARNRRGGAVPPRPVHAVAERARRRRARPGTGYPARRKSRVRGCSRDRDSTGSAIVPGVCPKEKKRERRRASASFALTGRRS